MTRSMDVAVCFDCSLLVSFYKILIKRIINFLIRHAASCNEDDIRMALMEFRSHINDSLTKTHSFTSSMNEYQTWIDDVETDGITHKECKQIASVLDECLTLNWRSNINRGRSHKNLVILFTDGPPCNLHNNECCTEQVDLWKLADEYARRQITLVIVGLEPCVIISDDFFCALARKTGGEYIPLINAQRVLSSVVEQATFGERTLPELFRDLNMHDDIEANSLYNHSYIKSRVSSMLDYCRTMNDIRKWFYSYGRPTREVEFCLPDFDENETDFEPGEPPRTAYINEHGYGFDTALTSTPLTDDEGYRTRLPTTASLNSSYSLTDESPVSSDEIDSLSLSW